MPGAERVRTVLPRNAHGIAVAGGPSPGLAVPFAIRPFTRPLTTTETLINILSLLPSHVITVLWPSGYGVTFRSRPIRDGKPREFESRQCQFFVFSRIIYLWLRAPHLERQRARKKSTTPRIRRTTISAATSVKCIVHPFERAVVPPA